MRAEEPNEAGEDFRSQKRKSYCVEVSTRATQIASSLVKNQDWCQLFNESNSRIRVNINNSHPLKELHSLLDSLTNKLSSFPGGSSADPVLVLVLDEAANLLNKPGSSIPSGMYVAINRVVSCLKSLPFWLFSLSTETEIEKLLPPGEKSIEGVEERDKYRTCSSARFLEPENPMPSHLLRLFPPFVSFPLDITDRSKMRNENEKVCELTKPFSKFATIEHMAQFGRPLWLAYGHPVFLFEFAKLKLRGGYVDHYIPNNENHAFASLSFRLSLDVLVENAATIPLLRTAVGAFMRVIIAVNQQSGFLNTVTPSEPILALAAMAHLCGDGSWRKSITTLSNQIIQQGLIEKGLKGELFSRLLIILAHDYIRVLEPQRHHDAFNLRPSFSVRDFLKYLYVQDHHEIIEQISDRVLNGRLNFNHFVSAQENLTSDVIPSLCHDLLRRSAALQLAPNQPTYDKLIPFYCGDEDGPYDDTKYGVILVQDKNKTESTSLDHIFQEDFEKISPPGNTSRNWQNWRNSLREKHPSSFVFNKKDVPFLFILLDMGVKKGSSPAVQVSCSRGKRTPKIWAVHSRGHSADVFRCLKMHGVEDVSESFFVSTTETSGIASDIARQNDLFAKLSRDYRYADHRPRTENTESEEALSSEPAQGGLKSDTNMTGA